MAHAAHIREKALELRAERSMTIDEIAERLAVSRTTVYYWVREMPIDRKYRYTMNPALQRAQRKGTRNMQRKFAEIRAAEYERGRREFDGLCVDPCFRDFVCMYIGEGYKRCRNTVSIANSDPRVVELGAAWIRRFSRNPVTYSIQVHADQDLEMLRQFWASRLHIPSESIVLQRKSNSNGLTGRTWRSKFGVMSVTANDTRLRARLEGWIDSAQADWLSSTRVIGA